MKTASAFLIISLSGIEAFSPSNFALNRCSALNARWTFEDVYDVGYDTVVSKPLGVIFGENREPFGGIVIDDVEPGLNGGLAGLRVGDQLVAINGEPCVGDDFDDIMTKLKEADGELDLQLYRGSIASLYTILENRGGDVEEEEEEEENEFDELTEDYESPVVINVDDYNKPLTAGDFVKAFKNLGKMLTEDDQKSAKKEVQTPEKPKEEKKKGGGIFGMFKQETIQLEGDEASGVKGQKRNRN